MARLRNLISIALVSAVVLCATAAPASISPPHDAPPLKRLAEWLLELGKQSVIRSHVLAAMDLPALDMPVRERGFRHVGENLTHVSSVSIAPGYRDLMFFAQVDESNGDATVWRTNLDGVLVDTITFSAGIAKRVPNAEFKAGFDLEKTMFTIRMQLEREREHTTDVPYR